MTYPSQPGYPAPQYGQPKPPQQNNLWLIGGAILVVLVIIMTVILLVVQQTAGNDSAEGGDGGSSEDAGGDESNDGGGDTGSDGDDDGGNDGGGDGGTVTEITADSCDAFNMDKFEEVYGAYDPDETTRTASTSGGLASLSCTFYNPDFTSVYLYITDHEDASDVVYWVESDADYYNEENGYEFSEYTEIGDAGTMYSSTSSGSKSTNIHVALGSLEVKVSTTLYDSEDVDEAAAIETLEDFLVQSDSIFADFQ
jgi:hypothetical protein